MVNSSLQSLCGWVVWHMLGWPISPENVHSNLASPLVDTQLEGNQYAIKESFTRTSDMLESASALVRIAYDENAGSVNESESLASIFALQCTHARLVLH